jgi:photosystem II stability/assembly factor-like uncharacterized protein
MSTRTASFFFRLFSAVVLLSLFVGVPGGVSNVLAGTDTWTTTGPGGGRILALAIDPETPATVYAGTWGSGVYKSTDGGGTWDPAGSGLSDTYINTLVIDPKEVNSLYVGTYHGIYKSTDAGGSWQEANTGITDYQIQTLAIDPQTPSTLYAGAFGCVFKSLDAGGHWSAKTTGLSNIAVWVMAVDPLDPDTLYAGTGFEGVYKSTDGGEHWYPVNTGLTDTNIYSLAIDPATPGTLYVGTEHGGIFKSTDGGESWRNVFTRLPESTISVRSLAIDPLTASILYAGTDNGVFRSTNGGEQWLPANVGLSMNSQVTALAVDSSTPATVYAGTWNDGGVYRSTDSGMLWTLANSGLANTMVYTLAIDPLEPATLYAGTYEFGVFKSNDAGQSWFPVNTGLTNEDVGLLVIDASTPSTLYAGTYDSLFKSSDGGGNWFPINTGLTVTDVDALAIDPVTPSTLYAGTYGGGVFKSADGGLHWQAFNHGLSALHMAALAIDPVTPSTLYAGTYGGGVFKSTNGGEDWFPVNNGLTFLDVKSMAIDPLTPSTLYAGTYGGGVFKSTNRGADWFPADDGLTMLHIMDLAIDPYLPATLYAATYGGVFKSTNGGQQWSAMNPGLTNTRINALAIDPVHPTTLYAGTDGAGAAKYSSSIIPCRATWGQVVINEIFPSPSDNGTEWVELYNTTAQPVNIGYCYIDDIPAAGSPPIQIPADTIIPAHGFWTLDQVSYFNNAGDDVRFLKEDALTGLNSYTFGNTGYDLSRFRFPDGGAWQASATAHPTKGESNGAHLHPIVSSIVLIDGNPTSASTVNFLVTFSKPVTGVNTSAPFSDFAINTSGLTGASISKVTGTEAVYTVSVNTGTGLGSLRLDVMDDDSIKDAYNIPLGGAGIGNGNYLYADGYTVTQGARITIGTQLRGTYPVLQNSSTRINQSYVLDGPVRVQSARSGNILSSERVVAGNSFNEVMGYPASQLTTEYWFPWYDNLNMDTWILVGNTSGTQTAAVDIYIGSSRYHTSIAPNGRTTARYPGVMDGPVRVVSTNGVRIFTSERAVYKGAFNEVMGYPASQLTTEYWFPFYDNKSMDTWILVGNPTASPATVDIYVDGAKRSTHTIPPGGRVMPRYPNLQTGLVRVVSTNGVRIFASERSLYGDSFNEVMGYPANQLTTEYWFPWYDNLNMDTWLLVGNPTSSTAKVDLYVGGVKKGSYTIGAGGRITPRFLLNTGPVRVVSTNAVKIFTSERVLYGTSFNEVMGYPGNKLTSEYWFPWYDSVSMSTDIVVGIP